MTWQCIHPQVLERSCRNPLPSYYGQAPAHQQIQHPHMTMMVHKICVHFIVLNTEDKLSQLLLFLIVAKSTEQKQSIAMKLSDNTVSLNEYSCFVLSTPPKLFHPPPPPPHCTHTYTHHIHRAQAQYQPMASKVCDRSKWMVECLINCICIRNYLKIGWKVFQGAPYLSFVYIL